MRQPEPRAPLELTRGAPLGDDRPGPMVEAPHALAAVPRGDERERPRGPGPRREHRRRRRRTRSGGERDVSPRSDVPGGVADRAVISYPPNAAAPPLTPGLSAHAHASPDAARVSISPRPRVRARDPPRPRIVTVNQPRGPTPAWLLPLFPGESVDRILLPIRSGGRTRAPRSRRRPRGSSRPPRGSARRSARRPGRGRRATAPSRTSPRRLRRSACPFAANPAAPPAGPKRTPRPSPAATTRRDPPTGAATHASRRGAGSHPGCPKLPTSPADAALDASNAPSSRPDARSYRNTARAAAAAAAGDDERLRAGGVRGDDAVPRPTDERGGAPRAGGEQT